MTNDYLVQLEVLFGRFFQKGKFRAIVMMYANVSVGSQQSAISTIWHCSRYVYERDRAAHQPHQNQSVCRPRVHILEGDQATTPTCLFSCYCDLIYNGSVFISNLI